MTREKRSGRPSHGIVMPGRIRVRREEAEEIAAREIDPKETGRAAAFALGMKAPDPTALRGDLWRNSGRN